MTLDEWFLPRAFPATDRLYFIQDSDELAIISLTEEDFTTPYLSENHHLNALFIAQWAESCAAPMHKTMFNYRTIWHEHDINHHDWRNVLERSEATAQEVRIRLSTPDIVQRSESPNGYLARTDRAKRYGKLVASEGPELSEISAVSKPHLTSKNKNIILIPSWLFKSLRAMTQMLPKKITRGRFFLYLQNMLGKHQLNFYKFFVLPKVNEPGFIKTKHEPHDYSLTWILKIIKNSVLRLKPSYFRIKKYNE